MGLHKANQTSFKRGIIPWNKGIPLSEETKIKLRKSLKGRKVWNKGIPGSVVSRKGCKWTEESKKRASIAQKLRFQKQKENLCL